MGHQKWGSSPQNLTYHAQVWEYPPQGETIFKRHLLYIDIAPIIVHHNLVYITNIDFIQTRHQFSVKTQVQLHDKFIKLNALFHLFVSSVKLI